MIKSKAKTKNFSSLSVGIDISKDNFHACIAGLLPNKQRKVVSSTKFDNTATGFEKFLTWVSYHIGSYEQKPEFLMEASGVYHENLAFYLYEQDERVVIVLGNHSKAFMKSEGIKTKNDKIDAKGLAFMSLVSDRRAWKPISPILQQIRTQTRHRAGLQKELTRMRNRLHALNHSHRPDKLVIKQLKVAIKLLEKQDEQIIESLQKIVKEDKEFEQKLETVMSIPGIGFISAITVIAETNGFELFTSLKQLNSFAGYDVVENQSGKHQGNTKISKKGNSHIRRILYFPAFTAVKQENVFKQLYQRIYEKTKVKMKAYTAVQRKLLCTMYTLWKKEEEFKDKQNKENKENKENKQNFVEEQIALLHEII